MFKPLIALASALMEMSLFEAPAVRVAIMSDGKVKTLVLPRGPYRYNPAGGGWHCLRNTAFIHNVNAWPSPRMFNSMPSPRMLDAWPAPPRIDGSQIAAVPWVKH